MADTKYLLKYEKLQTERKRVKEIKRNRVKREDKTTHLPLGHAM